MKNEQFLLSPVLGLLNWLKGAVRYSTIIPAMSTEDYYIGRNSSKNNYDGDGNNKDDDRPTLETRWLRIRGNRPADRSAVFGGLRLS